MAAPIGPYSPVVRAGNFLFVSGQIGLKDGELVQGLEAQARQSLQNLQDVLGSEGATLTNVVKTTVFLADMADFAAMNDIYAEVFGDHRPARSAVAAAGLPKGAVFEIEVVAHVG
jgi:2-iminobutanoate/2-iminopropanoate deaminase